MTNRNFRRFTDIPNVSARKPCLVEATACMCLNPSSNYCVSVLPALFLGYVWFSDLLLHFCYTALVFKSDSLASVQRVREELHCRVRWSFMPLIAFAHPVTVSLD